jgi:hypothetical protein
LQNGCRKETPSRTSGSQGWGEIESVLKKVKRGGKTFLKTYRGEKNFLYLIPYEVVIENVANCRIDKCLIDPNKFSRQIDIVSER